MNQPPADATAEPLKRPNQGRPDRKFGLLDAMILVAATAAGATSIRPFLLYGLGMPDLFIEFFPALGSFVYTAYSDSVVKFLSPWLASWTLACLAIRLRAPRPRFRRLMRQPGTVACVAATFAMATAAALCAAVLATVGVPPLEDFYHKILPYLCDSAAIAVVGAWSVANLAGRWKPEPGWIDRMGRVIGVLWILIFILSLFFACLFPAISAKYHPPGPSPAQMAAQDQLLEDQRKSQEQELMDITRETERLEREIEKRKQENARP